MGDGRGDQQGAVEFVDQLLLQAATRVDQLEQAAGRQRPRRFEAAPDTRVEPSGVGAVEQRFVQGEGFERAEPALLLDQFQGGLESGARAHVDQRAGGVELLDGAQQVIVDILSEVKTIKRGK